MNRILKTTFIICGLLLSFSFNTQAQDIKVGGGLTYGTQVESIGIEGGAILGFTDKIRGAADLKIFFPDSPSGVDNSFWEINANANYMFFSAPTTNVYGLAGLNYATQKVSGGGFTVSNSEAGLNLGGGAEFGVGFGTIFTELKYVLSNYDQLDLSAGVRFGL